MHDAEFHVFQRKIFLCEMPRNWSGLFRLEFFNTAIVFIHPVSNWPFGFSSVLETTLVTIYNVNHIREFTSDHVLWWECLTFKCSLGVDTGDFFQFLDFGAVGAFTQSGAGG